MISVSIVSHGQFNWVRNILADLEKYCAALKLEIILTINIPEVISENFNQYLFPIKLIHNQFPKGFGENHNQAFKIAQYDYFCVLNPDIRLIQNPFGELINCINQEKNKNIKIGVVGPMVLNAENQVEDSAREFLTIYRLLKRISNKFLFKINLNRDSVLYPDWIAGMFMFFSRVVYQEISGFDEKYFLYCEDMDLCRRLRQKKYEICWVPWVKVIHHAHRDSHKKLKYFLWHLKSLVRFLWIK